MSVLKDYACKFCGHAYEAWSDRNSCIRCGGTGDTRYTQLISTEWGGPRYIRSLDLTFDSRSSLHTYLRQNGLTQSPAADKRGGEHLGGGTPRDQARIHFDPMSTSSRSKGTWKRVDPER